MSMDKLKLFHYIHIHPTLMMFIGISIITGTFVHLFIILMIVMMHELGHFFAAKLFGWRIDKIMLWAFGGVLQTDEYTTRPIKEEVIVTLCGPLQHTLVFCLAYVLHWINFIPTSLLAEVIHYNVIILLFNLLPIYPLDGGRICFALLSARLPYRQAYRSILCFSLILAIGLMTFQLYLYPFTFTASLLLLFLIIELIKYRRNEFYIFMQFLLFRYHERQDQYKIKYINANENDRLIDLFTHFNRNKYHYLSLSPSAYMTESRALYYYFRKYKHRETIGEFIYRK